MKWFRRRSIRWRITIGSVLVGAVLLTGAALVFRQQIEQAQINSDKKLLYGATTPYIAQIENHPTQIDKPAGEQRLVVLNPAGVSVASNLPDALTGQLSALRRLGSGSHFVTLSGTEYLVIVRVVTTAEGKWRIVATRDQQTTTAIVLASLTNILIVGGVILLVGFGLASWLLTTAALRPVTVMRRRAESLQAIGSSELLPVGPARDELSALAITLNTFLARVRTAAAREQQMVSDASHELRTPIAVLLAHLELARRRKGDPVVLEEDLTAAAESAKRLARLATNLLTLSALEAGQPIQYSSWSELVDEFGAASDRARLLSLDKFLDVDFQVDGDAQEGTFPISVSNFAQIIDNLIGNAIQAIPRSATIQGKLSQTAEQLTLTVADTGPGMPADFIAVATDRFTRPDEHRGNGTGAGLGLAIVGTIVTHSGGSIHLENRVEGGLSVTVKVPRALDVDVV